MKKVLVIIDPAGQLIHVGHPSTFKKKLIGKYAASGCTIKTISIDEFRQNNYILYQKAPK